jgi:hypothetical protein
MALGLGGLEPKPAGRSAAAEPFIFLDPATRQRKMPPLRQSSTRDLLRNSRLTEEIGGHGAPRG